MPAARIDPLRGFRFVIEIEGLASGGFTRVKGLAREVKYESYREGGLNDYEHKLVTQVSYAPVVLERGIALDDLWHWALDVANGDIVRRKVSVRLQDESGDKGWLWHLDHALPVKWSCTDLDATASPVIMESLELAHHGLRKGR
jgi:phage tail-like protein